MAGEQNDKLAAELKDTGIELQKSKKTTKSQSRKMSKSGPARK